MSKVMKTMDGNAAAAHVAYAFTEVAGIYPITPSSDMAEHVDKWSVKGRKNIFNQTVKVAELQSEAGAAGTVHGSLAAGALTTTFTASQGLLLMIPNMYKMAGELLPAVIHVSARALAGHALSIFGDHSDVMACRQTGFAMLASTNVQETHDLASVAHLAAIKGRVPFVHFFDGFRTSHEIQKIELTDYKEYARLVDRDALKAFQKNSLNPERPVLRGTAQNPDIFFQAKEASNPFYDRLPAIVEEYMDEINKITGRDYGLFNYYGAPDAARVIIAMGSVVDTIEETVDYLNANGEKVGLLKVRLYRPFSVDHFLKEIPKTVKKIAVLDRTKEPGAIGEPLYLDVCTSFFDQEERPAIVGGRYGLGSKDTTPAQILAVFKNLDADKPMNKFTIGIKDDVTFKSLPLEEEIDMTGEDTISCKFWGLGSDGTVGANKNSIKIIGDHTEQSVQAYFAYDSKKSGGVTISHLRFGKKPIRSTYLINKANFVACHNPSYLDKYDMLSDLKEGGSFLLNCHWNAEELDKYLPAKAKKIIADRNIKLYTIDGIGIAKEIGLGNRINTVLQAAFFKLAKIVPIEDAVKYMKQAIVDSYGHKGDKVINSNYAAVDQGVEQVKEVEVPANWANIVIVDEAVVAANVPEFISTIQTPVNNQAGNDLPVSAFVGREDGTFPQGTSKFEKRGIAVEVPEWQIDNCIQCNQCSYVCPHAAIRPFLVNEAEVANAPEDFKTKKAMGKGFEEYQYKIQISTLDCTGCGNCAQVCPSKEKSLIMKPIETQTKQIPNWDYAMSLEIKENPLNTKTVKGTQFEQPLLEFSGACAGCGETPYIKLITQMFGDRMYIANATGCTSIWGGSAPSTPYTMNKDGFGPAWANSLFEDNAEFGYGMFLAVEQTRNRIKDLAIEAMELDVDADIKANLKDWVENMSLASESKRATLALLPSLQDYKGNDEKAQEIFDDIIGNKEHLVKKSQWIFGGDGWAYDIGFGGLDHVLASGDDVNIFVVDTEVYSNTGGQASKSTPTGSIAQFASSGKRTKKKDLGMMMMSYGYVYVAQVAMGANQGQLIKALQEAEAYPGPSLIIAYAPCINHGLNLGMGSAQLVTKNAVEAGYWHMYRYNPLLKDEGKNPFILDSKAPTTDFKDHLMSEVRYSSLTRSFPKESEVLFDQAAEDAKERLQSYQRMAAMEY